MKRLSLLLVMMITVCLSFAGIDEYYTFNATTGTYTPITGTVVTEILSDDAISSAIQLGFVFSYGDQSYNSIKISSNGWIDLGALQSDSNLSNSLSSTTYCPVIAPLWDDISMATGSVEYLLSGTTPNRVFTIQYTNLRWNYSADNQFNMQARLYENGKIDMVYGSATGTPNFPSASIGISMLPGGAGWFYSVTPGTPSTASTTVENNSISEFPPQGTIFEFLPVTPVPNDLAALSLTGSTTPTVNISANYTVTVRNRGSNPQTNYQVKLYQGAAVEIGSVAGTAIQPGEVLNFTIAWTPTVAGPAVLYGKVILAGDENPANDQTPNLNITVQPEGVQAVTIGDGSELQRVPMDFYWKNSLYECVFMADELGFVSGTITSLQFYNNFVTDLPNGATKIWLGSTNQTDLSGGWIPSTQLTQVFDGVVQYHSGANTITIPLQTPYMHTPGNLVLMVNRPMDAVYYNYMDYFQAQTMGTNRARNVYSDVENFDPANPPAGTLSGITPKTTIFYSGQMIVNDLGCLSISGNTTPSVGAASDYTITVKNNGTATQTNYQVKLMKEGGIEVGSVPGVAINSLQTLQFTVPWTPTAIGATYIYGQVVMAGDEIATNNQTQHLNVVVQPEGIVAVTVGTGGSTGRMPVDMFYMNSLFETIYLASELNIGGLLTAVQFYNNFQTNLPNMPTNIWIGETTQTDLSGGWIPSTQLTPVFSGSVNYPNGANNILITLTTPYAYGGGNLVIMVQRPMDTTYYSSMDVFVTQTGNVPGRTLNVYADGTPFDPANPPQTTPQAMFPKATFMFITAGLGSITGTVYEGTTPLAGATVTVTNTPLTYTTTASGTYNFPYVAEGQREVSATKHGYNVVNHTVTVVEDEVTTQNFTLTQLAQVSLTGRIVGSDNPTLGLAGAIINLTGYEPYTATANASGVFTIPNVYASQTYDYVVTAQGYAPTNGQVVVGTTNVNMGDVIVNEIAFPPVNVIATEAANYSNVTVTWNSPGTAQASWIHYDSGENDDSIGTGGVADFDVAIRFPASALMDYAGTSLQAVKVWPAQPGSFSVRVWTGGNATAPAQMLVDQPFTPTLDTYNTVVLNDPVYISGSEELWFGYRCNVTSGYPAGCDAGPQVEGFGNMIYWQGAWATLTSLNPALTYNWNIQGYVGYGPPTRLTKLQPLAFNANRFNSGSLAATGIRKESKATLAEPVRTDRTREGYKVWRLLAANQGNENLWTLLTPTTIADTTYIDNAWQPLPSGVYKFAVKAVYTNNVMSTASLSNEIHKGMMGVLTGTVTDFGTGSPIEGAVVTAGTYTGTSNAQGQYSFQVYQGSYTVTATKTGYQPYSQPNVSITGLQTTTLNIPMMEIAYPAYNVVATEAGDFSNVVVTWMAPDPNAEPVEGFESGDFTAFPWVMGGTQPWIISTAEYHSGTHSAQSGDINDGENSTIQTTRNVLVAGNVSFWYKISSEAGWDYLTFYIDGVEMDSWSGEIPWTMASYPLTLGNHTLMWEYSKDLSVSSGSDCAWIDDIEFPASTGPTYYELSKLFKTASQAENPKSADLSLRDRNDADSRTLIGYRVWRLLASNQGNETLWTQLTPANITATTYTDNNWAPLPSGVYKFAVKAVYTNNVMSLPSFSNEIHKGMMGVLTGTVTEFGTGALISGATITAGDYSGTSNAQGVFSFSVYAGTYSVTCAKVGYQTATQAGVIITGLQTTTQNFVLTEITLPPGAVQASNMITHVNVTWMEPGTGGGEWIHYDSGENDDSIGTGAAADFDVAIRFPGSALTDYLGMSLYALKLWPAQAGTFTAKVWTGGTPTAPAQMVLSQPFTPTLDTYNTVVLTTPVVVENQELWFGYNCNVTSGYPAGCDAGPQVEGFGNMIYWQGAWATLTSLNPALTYNWNIQGYVGYSAPANRAIEISPIGIKTPFPIYVKDADRTLQGYRVWRLLQGQENSENMWTALTPNPITATAYQDTGWAPLPDGTYKWAVKAIYTGGAASVAAISNPITKLTEIGTIAGIVRTMQNAPIMGATVTCGDVTATTNSSGAYSMMVDTGVQSVTASHPNYQSVTHDGVIVVMGQTTTVNFQLPVANNLLVDGFESYDNFALAFAPWTLVDVDQSATYGMTGISWPNAYAAQAYMVFVPSATTPPVTDAEPHGGIKMAACFAATTPPNNDWLITPVLNGADQLRFWAKSYTDQYGLERFKVGVSTTGTNPANFTIISGTSYIQAPTEWTEYTYDLSSYGRVPIYVGIQCVSNDAFIFFVDDVVVGGSPNGEDTVPVAATELRGNFPNPFNPTTTISYSVKTPEAVTIEIFNVKGQLIKTLVSEAKEAGNHTVVWNGDDNSGRRVSSGIYYYKMSAGKYSSTRKMVMMK
jgi:hypothetical protein